MRQIICQVKNCRLIDKTKIRGDRNGKYASLLESDSQSGVQPACDGFVRGNRMEAFEAVYAVCDWMDYCIHCESFGVLAGKKA